MTNKSLEDQSFENMVRFFAPELRRIMRGRSARELLGNSRRRALRRYGVLEKNKKRSVSMVSEKAQRVLEDVK